MEYVIFTLELLARLSCSLHFLPVHVGKDLIVCSSSSRGGIFGLCFHLIPLFTLLVLLLAVIIKLLVLLISLISMPCALFLIR